MSNRIFTEDEYRLLLEGLGTVLNTRSMLEKFAEKMMVETIGIPKEMFDKGKMAHKEEKGEDDKMDEQLVNILKGKLTHMRMEDRAREAVEDLKKEPSE